MRDDRHEPPTPINAGRGDVPLIHLR